MNETPSRFAVFVAELSRIESLRVVSRTTVARYAGTSMSMPEIAAELGVQAIVEGSVLRAGDRVRITVQLIHGATDNHLWSSSYQRQLQDIIALQSEVAQAIAREIQAELGPEQEERFAALTTVSPDAHEAYLRGRFEQVKGTPEGFEAAARLYEEAVEIDSTYAPAYAGLAASQMLLGMSDTAIVVDQLPEVIEAAQRAILLDSASPEALAVLAGVQMRLGRAVDSVGDLKMTVSLDSLHAPSAEWLARHTDFGRQMEMVSVGRRPEAAESVAPDHNVETARRLAAAGEYETAAEILRCVLERYPSETAAWDALERVHAARGDYDEAFERLARADEARDPRLFALRSEPVWDPVRADPRFRDLLRRIRETRWPDARPAPSR